MRRPRSVRIGMFWRFGSDDERRPVAATAWWNVVCRRPSDAMSAGSASMYVERSFVYVRQSRIGSIAGWTERSSSSTAASVE